jgi:beta-galactosidase/beta-glucuronidase
LQDAFYLFVRETTSGFLIGLLLLLSCQPTTAQTVRETVSFDDDWAFHLGDVHGAQYPSFDDSDWRQLDVPHDWSIEQAFSEEHASAQAYLPGGVGWYRKTFTVLEEDQGKIVKVLFDGVYQNSEVWINGERLGKRPYGYISFAYDLTDHLNYGGENTMAVRVDHSNDADSRWYTGSGITRHVWLRKTNPVRVGQWGVFVRTPWVTDTQATAAVTTTVVNGTDAPRPVTLNSAVERNGEHVTSADTTIRVPADAERKVDQRIQIEDSARWSPESPHLYRLVSEIERDGQRTDRKETRFGVRTAHFDAQEGFFLNGEPMLIKGVCLHHDAGAFGAAVPVQEWRDRLKLMKEMGVNALRTSHNPPAPELLTLADEMGFLVMDEAFDEWALGKKKWIQGWNVGQEEGAAGLGTYYSQHGYSDFFEEWAKQDLQDMVRRDRNHPSVILWSIGNEVDYPNDPYTDPTRDDYQPWRPSAYQVTEIARHLYDYVKAADSTRPVTAAVANAPLANETGYAALLDVVGYNYQEQHYEDDHQAFPERKIIGSETGDSYEAWQTVKNNEYIPGQFLWTGIDYLGEAGRFPNRSNDSGVVTLSNVRKPGFYYRKSLWTDEPMVYLATADSMEEGDYDDEGGASHWTWDGHEGEPIEVVAYTNSESVELYLNGESLGRKTPADTETPWVRWSVPYEPGTLGAVARTNGEEVASYELRTAGEPDRIRLTPNRLTIGANGDDISSVRVEVVDAEGIQVPDATHEVQFDVDGPGGNIGVGNSDHESLAPYKADHRNVHNGRARVIIQSDGTDGEIQVQASADGIESDTVTIVAE